jgi:hypothetical protein
LYIGEVAIICDFSEKCSIIQDEVQGFLWNNAQAIFRLFAAYYLQHEMTVQIDFVISDCLKHYTVGVHLFQSKLCIFLFGKLKDLAKIYNFSVGVGAV